MQNTLTFYAKSAVTGMLTFNFMFEKKKKEEASTASMHHYGNGGFSIRPQDSVPTSLWLVKYKLSHK